MKHILITTIAAVLLVGCGPPKPPDTSIHDAAEEGNIEAVKQHIAAGTDVNAKYADGELTPLLIAAGEGQKEIAELLIAKGADVNAKSWSGATPLLTAAIDGHKEIAELLIARGADVNAKEDDGWTPLHYAISEGHKETVELLIANGADVNAKKANGETPLDLAWRDDRTSALLLKHGGKTGAELSIHKAASEGNIEAVKQHLAAGADVNAKTMHGDTPLDSTIKDKHPELADLLRKHGGKHSTINAAAAGGDIEAVKGFLAAGADVNAKDEEGWTPLHFVAVGGNKEIAELLINNGADVNTKVLSGVLNVLKGKTPLDFAVDGGHTETADLLREHGGKTGEELKAEGK